MSHGNNTLDAEILAPLKFLNNSWRSLLLICEIRIDLLWSSYSTKSEILRTPAIAADQNAAPTIQTAQALLMCLATF